MYTPELTVYLETPRATFILLLDNSTVQHTEVNSSSIVRNTWKMAENTNVTCHVINMTCSWLDYDGHKCIVAEINIYITCKTSVSTLMIKMDYNCSCCVWK